MTAKPFLVLLFFVSSYCIAGTYSVSMDNRQLTGNQIRLYETELKQKFRISETEQKFLIFCRSRIAEPSTDDKGIFQKIPENCIKKSRNDSGDIIEITLPSPLETEELLTVIYNLPMDYSIPDVPHVVTFSLDVL
ncbi:hypothetical protein CI610_01136 [invertebrate metagenome]|uniref:Uncharacterized protein n=1 Tax=invertebrate metagenome TaxID=1711999 RepID=A0A2H9T9L1_9ZZZZ